VEEARKALVGKIGENMSIRRFKRMEAKGRLAQYVHGLKIGVLIDYSGGDDQLGKELAMHVAASKPIGLSKNDVPADVAKKEHDIAAAKAAESGKPDDIAKKMIEGSMQKFLKEVTLLGQIFVKDPAGKQTVEALLKARGASVSQFALFVVGEGVEKKGNGAAG
jgi:elongation factor Ts